MNKSETLEKTIVEEIGGKVTKLKKKEDYYHVIVEKDGISLKDLNRIAEKVNDENIMFFSDYERDKTKLLIDY